MRRKTWLAGLALLGICPGVALAQQPSSRNAENYRTSGAAEYVAADTSEEWISLNDEADVDGAEHATPASNVGMQRVMQQPVMMSGGGGGGGGYATGVRRWDDPGMRGGWVNVDYLYWTLGGYNLPPLVTTAPNGVIPQLGNLGVNVVVGNQKVDDEFRSGGRVRAGFWADDNQTAGFEGHFYGFEQTATHFNFSQSGPGALSLGRPFIEVAPNFPTGVAPGEAALLAALTDGGGGVLFNGRADVDTSSNIYSAGILARHFLAEQPGVRIDAVGGFRYFQLDEGLFIQSTAINGPANPAPLPIGFTRRVTDIFNCANQFYGAEFGFNMETDLGELISLEIVPKVAIGDVHQRIDMTGTKSFEFPGLPADVRPGGLLVNPSNTGSPLSRAQYERDGFAVMPEINVNAGIQLTRQVRATIGWSSLWISDVVRPGQQIDRAVNTNQLVDQPIVGPTRPLFNFNSTDVWLYGVNVGIESTY